MYSPINSSVTIQNSSIPAVKSNAAMSNQSQSGQQGSTPQNTNYSGFVLSRGAEGAVTLRTPQGDLQFQSSLFLKTGAEVNVRIEQNPNGAQGTRAHIVSVDGKAFAEVAKAQGDKANPHAVRDNVSTQSGAASAAAGATVAGAQSVILQASVQQMSPEQAKQLQNMANMLGLKLPNTEKPNILMRYTPPSAEGGTQPKGQGASAAPSAGSGNSAQASATGNAGNAGTAGQSNNSSGAAVGSVTGNVGSASNAINAQPTNIAPSNIAPPNAALQATAAQAGDVKPVIQAHHSAPPASTPSPASSPATSQPPQTPAQTPAMPTANAINHTATSTNPPAPPTSGAQLFASLQQEAPERPATNAQSGAQTYRSHATAPLPTQSGGGNVAAHNATSQSANAAAPATANTINAAGKISLPLELTIPNASSQSGGSAANTLANAVAPSSAAANTTPATPNATNAPQHATLLQSAIGDIKVAPPIPLSVGSNISVELLAIGSASEIAAKSAALSQPSTLTSSPQANDSNFQFIAKVFGLSTNTAAANILTGNESAQATGGAALNTLPPSTLSIVPQANSGLTTSLLQLFSALQGNSLNKWLSKGDAVSSQLSASSKNALEDGFEQWSQNTRPNASQPWQQFAFPLLHEGELNPVHLYYREEDEGEDGTAKEHRFVVDVALSQLGELQIDGLFRAAEHVSNASFNVIMRSAESLPDDVRAHVIAVFEEAQAISGFNGGVRFQVSRAAFIDAEAENAEALATHEDDHSLLI